MLIRFLAIGIVAVASCSGSYRVERVMQVPLRRAQEINFLTADRNGDLIVTGTNVDGGFIYKLDPTGNVVFTFANLGSFPAGAAVDRNGDVYLFGSGGAPRTEPGLYAPGVVNISAMLQKQIHFGEKRFIDFRCQANNVINHFNPGAPNTAIGAPGVGTITSGNAGRNLILTLKLHY